MKEIEIKVLNVNKNEIEKILIKLGAKKIYDGTVLDLFFNHPNIEYDGSLRLRKTSNNFFLTSKTRIPNKNFKIMEENEIKVSNFETTQNILFSLGFKENHRIKKNRVSYRLNNIKFELDKYLDEYSFIPHFVEIECEDLELINYYIKKLNLENKERKPWGISQLVNYYQKLNSK